jgi:hypothetical protein
MSETTDEDPKDEPRLMTSIDGEPARLLVHIEPLEDPDDPPTEDCTPAPAPPPDLPGLAE